MKHSLLLEVSLENFNDFSGVNNRDPAFEILNELECFVCSTTGKSVVRIANNTHSALKDSINL